MSKINVRSISNENDDGAPDIVGVSTFSSTAYFVPLKELQHKGHQIM